MSAFATPIQAKLLRLLEHGTFRHIGGTEELVSKALIVPSGNASLPILVDSWHPCALRILRPLKRFAPDYAEVRSSLTKQIGLGRPTVGAGEG